MNIWNKILLMINSLIFFLAPDRIRGFPRGYTLIFAWWQDKVLLSAHGFLKLPTRIVNNLECGGTMPELMAK
jgi:hypothetical protein